MLKYGRQKQTANLLLVLKRFASKHLGSDPPLSYMNSKARNFKLKDTMMVNEKTKKREKYIFPLGWSIFTVLMYLLYFKDYGEEKEQTEIIEKQQQKIVEYGASVNEAKDK